MSLFRSIYHMAAAGAVLLALVCRAYGILLLAHLQLWPDPVRRRRLSESNVRLAGPLWRHLSLAFGVTTAYRLPQPDRGKPNIVIANQRSPVYSLIVASACSRLEMHNLRWVAIAKTADFWVIGRIYGQVSAFVRQNDHKRDIAEIRWTAKQANRETAGMVIFPEGGNWSPRKSRPGWKGVLPPRRGGFKAICREMPEGGVLVLTIRWYGPAGKLARRLGIQGNRLTVSGRYYRSVPGSPTAWLNAEWRRIEDEVNACTF